MFDKFIEDDLIVKITVIAKETDKTDKNAYKDFMKNIILDTSGVN